MKPRVMHPKNEETFWVDYPTGWAIDPQGNKAQIIPGRGRKKANLADVLDTAYQIGVQRIVYCRVPETREGTRHWLYVETPGWEPGTHWLEPPTGRFTKVARESDEEPYAAEVRTAGEWFPADVNPSVARDAWSLLWRIIEGLSAGSRSIGLMKTPGATGANLWAASLPRNLDLPETPADIREELHSNSGQHHIDHFVTGGECDCGNCRPLVAPDAKGQLPGFYYVDGRFMYASVCRELGVGGRRMTAEQATDLFLFQDRGRYERAWYKITARVPKGWRHLGLLAAKKPDTMDWHYPNRPGAKFTTWADAAEVDLAMSCEWGVEIHEGIRFQKARVMDTWADRLKAARETAQRDEMIDPDVRRAVTTALRSILLYGIGALYSRGRDVEKSAPTRYEVPEEYRHLAEEHGNRYIWREPAKKNTAGSDRYWPELTAQVWGRARARVLSTPTAHGIDQRGGALAVDPSTLIGINGDAIYTTTLPEWSLPTGLGGGDDGKVGRLRLQGAIPRPVAAPMDRDERNALRVRAEREGTGLVYGQARGTR